MKVLLIDIDSKIPNLALKKIEKYHLDRGDEVIWHNRLLYGQVDKTYVSVIFSWNRYKAEQFSLAEKGGSGWDLTTNLPPEIEEIKPRINFGFTTRGCIRNCYFCIVPKKEGGVRTVGDIYDIWDGKSRELVIMDNNILALPEHFKLIASQLRKEKLKVDFNQGLDHRLLTEDLAQELLTLKHIHEIRFAFDDLSYKPSVLKSLDILKQAGIKDWGSRWYVYIGKKDTFESVFERMEILRSYKQGVYVMRDREIYNNPKWMALSCWGNTMGIFKNEDFFSVLKRSERLKSYRKYFEEELANA